MCYRTVCSGAKCGVGSRRDWRPITGIDLHSRTSARVGRHHHDDPDADVVHDEM